LANRHGTDDRGRFNLDAELVGEADDRLDVGQDRAGGAVRGNRELLITNLACQGAHLFDDPWTGTRQANVSRHNAEVGHEVQEALFDLEGGIGDRGGLQPVAKRLVVQVNAGTGPIEVAIRAACVVLSAHLDTVFGPELDVSVSRRGLRLEGPGIADNARGLAALVTVGEALTRARVHTERPILFAATVGEEGSGDLRGVRHLLGPTDRPTVRPSAFIALDGAGIERIVHRALGARRYRVTYAGPGGHSWAACGVANPANAVGRAVAMIAQLPTHNAPRTTHAVVRIGGGTSLNSIPQTAWFEIDLRSEDPRALQGIDEAVHATVTAALHEENRQRVPGTAPLAMDVRRVGD